MGTGIIGAASVRAGAARFDMVIGGTLPMATLIDRPRPSWSVAASFVPAPIAILLAALAGCSSPSGGASSPLGGSSGGAAGGRSPSLAGSSGQAGTPAAAGGSFVGAAGAAGTDGDGHPTGGDGATAGAAGSSGSGGLVSIGGSAGGGGAGRGGAGGASVAGKGGASGCNLPATVSFQKDVQPFLIKTCGSSGSSGCHIIDAVSTMSAGGWDHAYDWITAGAHASSCPEKPTPLRFQVVIAVIDSADPPSCSKSRQMPPPNATGSDLRAPLTACEIATLQAWLDEPYVTQMHRADDSSPTTPYPMPPFN
jgi:hypothetical protein